MMPDFLKNVEKYRSMHPGFDKAFGFLMRPDICSLEPGRYEIDGEKVFATVFRGPAKGECARLEAHRKYIDIQCTLKGADVIGVKPLGMCVSPVGGYDEGGDIMFFSDRPEKLLEVTPSCFVILYPEDAHAPLSGKGEVTKAVVKVLFER